MTGLPHVYLQYTRRGTSQLRPTTALYRSHVYSANSWNMWCVARWDLTWTIMISNTKTSTVSVRGCLVRHKLVRTIQDWASSINSKGQTDVILLDFSKAFDKVSHWKLLHKIHHYGIRGKTKSWITAFLDSRQQQVVVNGRASNTADVLSGVPQGTVLGPMLFLLYINDITDGVSSTMRLFADDSILYRDIHDPRDHETLVADIKTLHDWAKTWQMDFNVSKYAVLTITNKRKPSTHVYTMNGQEIPRRDKYDYLGVTIDPKLSWKDHISRVCGKGNKPFWRYIKAKRQDTIGVAPLLQHGTLHNDSQAKARILNEQFESVFTKGEVLPNLPALGGNPSPNIPELSVDVRGTHKLLTQLKINKASGPDGLPNRVLRELADQLAPVLAAIFQQSLVTHSLPEDWRNANVTPIYKKGDRHKAVNYRPVSLTCVCVV